MNVKLLRKIQKHILAEPKRLAMADWVQRKSPYVSEVCDYNHHTHKFAECGTAACIAGWACILSKEKFEDWKISSTAERLLQLENGATARALFGVTWWPSNFGHAYEKAKKASSRARIAAARIDHFIKTKGAE